MQFNIRVQRLNSLLGRLRQCFETFPDKRRGMNITYSIADIAMAAFSVFFMQSPSFLAYQRHLQEGHGRSNCECLFGISKIPSDNHIRDMLDPADPALLYPMFPAVLRELEQAGGLSAFRRLGNHVLIALDGSEYFCSNKISCAHCSTRLRGKGKDKDKPRQDRILPRHAGCDTGGAGAQPGRAAGAGVHLTAGRCREAGLRDPCDAALAGQTRRPICSAQPDLSRRRSALPPAHLRSGPSRPAATSCSSANRTPIR